MLPTYMDTYDVIIVGGGLAGCSTALSLAKSAPTVSFLLIDNADPTQFKIGESLPAQARQILGHLSPSIIERLLQDATRGAHTTCAGNASVWQSPELQETFAITNPFGSGWHLDRAAFDESLREYLSSVCANEGPKQRILLKGAFSSVQKDEHGMWVVHAECAQAGEKVYRSKWLIDASGRQASVARKIGAKTVKLDGLLAFYAVFASTNVDKDSRTLIEATEIGWWYSSRLPDQRRIVVFHTDDCDPPAKAARKQDGFMDMLHGDTTYISQTISDNDYRPMSGVGASYPRCTSAGSSFLSPFGNQEERWCAVGDAAIAFDPLSSQGMMTALRMGYSVGAMLAKQLQTPGDSMDVESITALFEETRRDYELKRGYFYAQSMFEGAFWQRRRE